MPLNVITMGKIIADHIDLMITISKYLTFIKYVIESYLGLGQSGSTFEVEVKFGKWSPVEI
jgi:hypothetical protein